jgi:hypothetical protein
MTADDAKWWLLVLAADDYCSLVEALWEFGLPDNPVPGAPDEATVRRLLWDLVQQDLVGLHYCREIYGDTDPVSPDDLSRVFDDPQSWAEPHEGQVGIRFACTPLGDDLVRSRSLTAQ